jgi:hypothetical protein
MRRLYTKTNDATLDFCSGDGFLAQHIIMFKTSRLRYLHKLCVLRKSFSLSTQCLNFHLLTLGLSSGPESTSLVSEARGELFRSHFVVEVAKLYSDMHVLSQRKLPLYHHVRYSTCMSQACTHLEISILGAS